MKFLKKSPWTFILLIGIVSLFADMTYEGARSITGPFLATLGASATVVGVVAGLGELLGNALRLVSGWIADKTQKYWTITFTGYFINLLAVPLLALAGSWQMAAVLMILERTGKAIRKPARDAMLSNATSSVGHGKGFGVHEALDQIGAVSGPLIVSIVFFFSKDYHHSFAVLFIPALLALSVLVVARINFPDTKVLEVSDQTKKAIASKRFYWIYLIALSLIGAGFADYSLIAYHFDKSGQVMVEWIPVMYAVAMGVDALAALLLGKLFDKYGIRILIFSTIISLLFAPLVFQGNLYTAIAGMICWGVGMGAQESIVSAMLASILPAGKRASGFGMFYAIFGVAWFLGSALMGWLYDVSVVWLIVFSVVMQLAAIPFFWKLTTLKMKA
jgi:MFS family permease